MNKLASLFLLLLFFGSTDAMKKNVETAGITIPGNLCKYAKHLNKLTVEKNKQTGEVKYKKSPVKTYDLKILQNSYKPYKSHNKPNCNHWQAMVDLISELIKLFELKKKIGLANREINEQLAGKISKIFSQRLSQENLNMLYFLIDYFGITCLRESLYVKLARDLHNNKNVEFVTQLHNGQKKEILSFYYFLYQQECTYNCGYCLDYKEFYEKLTLEDLVDKGILPTIKNHNQDHIKEYACHPQLHLFFDNIPYCQFKIQLIKEIYNYACQILQQNNRQQIFNNLSEGILKLAIRLIARDDQLQLDTNDIDVTKVRNSIRDNNKNNAHFFLFPNSIKGYNEYEKAIHYILFLLPHLCPNLQELSIRFVVKLETLPPEIGHLTNLQRLWLCENQLKTLPPEIGKLTNLKNLNLSVNQLKTLPPEIGKLVNLQRLCLSYNKLKALPKEIANLKNLKQLDLIENELESLLKEIGELKTLMTLNLSYNRLRKIPPELGKLTNLKDLDLAHNLLEILPPKISQLKSLNSLDLSHNEFEEWPPELWSLEQLQRLYLSENDLTEIPPPEIQKLKKLENLDLRHNKIEDITHLPERLVPVLTLNYVNLKGNPVPTYLKNIISLTRLMRDLSI